MERTSGGGHHRHPLRREPVAGRPQGHWQECAGGKPGHRVRPPQLERVLLHQHRRRTLLGTDTFENGAVQLRKGPIYQCAETGGFGVLDEINMAKNESLAVLHATLDFRRSIDMPGYERIPLHDATRFIATMNYGYAGTRELNEALASRFVVIDMPAITTEGLIKLLKREFPSLKGVYAEQFAGLFQDIQKKCDGGELLPSLWTCGACCRRATDAHRLEGNRALDLGLVNKSFDDFERQLVRDVIRTRLPETLRREDVFD